MNKKENVDSWLDALRNIQQRVNKTQPDDELDKLIIEIEDYLREKKGSRRKLFSLGRKSSDVVFNILIRYCEHEAIQEILKWLMK